MEELLNKWFKHNETLTKANYEFIVSMNQNNISSKNGPISPTVQFPKETKAPNRGVGTYGDKTIEALEEAGWKGLRNKDIQKFIGTKNTYGLLVDLCGKGNIFKTKDRRYVLTKFRNIYEKNTAPPEVEPYKAEPEIKQEIILPEKVDEQVRQDILRSKKLKKEEVEKEPTEIDVNSNEYKEVKDYFRIQRNTPVELGRIKHHFGKYEGVLFGILKQLEKEGSIHRYKNVVSGSKVYMYGEPTDYWKENLRLIESLEDMPLERKYA